MIRWELPEGWEWTTLGEIADIGGGLTKNKAARSGGTESVPLVSVAAVQFRHIDLESLSEIELTEKDGDTGQLRPGDLLVVEGNGSIAHIGRVAIWDQDVPRARHQNHVIRVRPRHVSSGYLLEWLASPAGRAFIVDSATSVSGLYTLSLSKVARLPVPLAPDEDRDSIVSRLSALQARITTARAGLDDLRQLATALKRAVLDAAFRGDLTATWREAHPDTEPASALLDRLRTVRRRRWQEAHPKKAYIAPEPVDPTDLPELPEGWCWAALEEITDFVTSGSRGWAEHYSDDGALFIRVGNLDRDTISLDLSERTHVRPPVGAEGDRTRLAAGDILVSITADVGMVGLIPEGIGEAYVNQHVAMIRPVPGVRPAILAWGLLNPHGAGPIINESHYGMTKASLSLPQVRRLPVALPPEGEHQLLVDAIAGSLATAECVSAATHELSDDLTTTEHALLTAAFCGELLPPAAP